MNKFAASLGLLAVGASVLHAAESSSLNAMQRTKAWSVAASLRGFYDDNVGSQSSGETDSYGYQINPSIDFGMPGEMTSFNVGYSFSAKYYDSRPTNATDDWDLTHTFDALLNHTFSPRFSLTASESFVIGQESDTLRVGNAAIATPQRLDGDNIRNYASIDLNIDVTQLLAFGVGYNNTFYDYDQEGVVGPIVTAASNSGLLDRMEHSVNLDSLWKLTPQTVGIVGYMYSQTVYNGDEQISGNNTLPPGTLNAAVFSEDRDSRGHTLYVGAQHVFSSTLSGSVKVGGQYYDYYNTNADAEWSPYFQGSLTYIYQTRTSFDLGFTYSRSAANAAGIGGNSFVLDTAAAVLYAAMRQELMANLVGSASVTLQNAEYNGGGPGVDGQGFLFYQLGLDLSYQFNPNLSAHVGYNYDQMDSDIGNGARDFDRNRIYVGVTAGF